jgi:hypothetical protein
MPVKEKYLNLLNLELLKGINTNIARLIAFRNLIVYWLYMYNPCGSHCAVCYDLHTICELLEHASLNCVCGYIFCPSV